MRRHALWLMLSALLCVGLLSACSSEYTTPGAGPHARLNAVALLPSGEGWAVGEAGTILRYTGNRWDPVPSPTSADLYGVALASADEAWAVGLDVAAGHAVILHESHGRWSLVPGITVPALRAVAMVAPGEGWTVGDGGTLLHLVNGRWMAVNSPTTADLMSVTMRNASDGWATGFSLANTPTGAVYTGIAIHFTGGAWKQAGIARDARIYAVAADAQVTWLVGGSASGGGTILYGSNGLFTPTGGNVEQELHAVVLASASEGWAVGFDGAIYHESFNRWEPAPSPTTIDLFGLAIASATEGWAVGSDGVILHLRNDIWTRYAA